MMALTALNIYCEMANWNYRKRNYKYYKKGSSLVKRAKGNLRASKAGNDQVQFTITFTYPVVLSGGSLSLANPERDVNPGVQALNIWDLLIRADNFKAYKKMYEQCRIDYVYVKLNVTNSQITTDNAQQMYDIYCAWDRTGVARDDLVVREVNNEILGVYCIMGPKITEYSGSKSQLNAFQRWSKTMYIAPKALNEKTQFVNTGEIYEWRNSYDATHQYYPFLNKLTGDNREHNYAMFMNEDNPCILQENGKYPFKPTLLLGAFKSGMINQNLLGEQASTVQMNQPLNSETKIIMTCEFKVVMTFKGPRGSQSIG